MQFKRNVLFLPVVLLALGLAACGSGSAGHNDSETETLSCKANADCVGLGDECYCQSEQCVCPMDGDKGDDDSELNPDLLCAVNADCVGFGDSCLCVDKQCYCPPLDGDSESGTEEGPSLCVTPLVYDFGGSHNLRQTYPSDPIVISNCGSKGTLYLNDTPLLFPPDTTSEYFSNFKASEWALVNGLERNGATIPLPSQTSFVALQPGESVKATVSYTPSDPGGDASNLLIFSSAGYSKVQLSVSVKGQPQLAVTCDDIAALTDSDASDSDEFTSDDVIPGYEQYDGAYNIGSVPYQTDAQSRVITCHLKNLSEDNNVLVIDGTQFEFADFQSKEAVYYSSYRISNITYSSGSQIWVTPGQPVDFQITFSPIQTGILPIYLKIVHNGGVPSSPYFVPFLGFGVQPKLKVDSSLDFGSVEAGACKQMLLPISNIGSYQLTLNSVSLSEENVPPVFSLDKDTDDDGSDDIDGHILQPGQSVAPQVKCCPTSSMQYHGELSVASSASEQLTTVYLTCGGIQANCQVSPTQLDFGTMRVGDSKTLNIAINNLGGAAITYPDIRFTDNVNGVFSFGGGGSGGSGTVTIAPGGTALIPVVFSPTSEAIEMATISLTPETGHGCSPATIQVTGQGVQPLIESSLGGACLEWTDVQKPPSTAASDLSRWTTAKPVTIHNKGSWPLTLSAPVIPAPYPSDEFLIESNGASYPVTVPGGAYYTFYVRYVPTGPGDDNVTLLLCSDATNTTGSTLTCNAATYGSDTTPYSICLKGHAIDPRLSVTTSQSDNPYAIVFRGVEVGQTASALVTIKNSGLGAMTVNSIGFLDAGNTSSPIKITGISSDLPKSIEGVNDTITVTISFTPPTNASASYSRQLLIKHNDLDAAKPGEDPGAEYDPGWIVPISASSSMNTAPIAILKSPVDTPSGRAGSRTRRIPLGMEIQMSGASSYDNDSDDGVVSYGWEQTVGSTSGMTFTSSTNAQIATAKFTEPGDYTIQLRVGDTHGLWSDTTPMDSRLDVTVYEAPIAAAFPCNSTSQEMDVEPGVATCFSGSSSYDNDGTIVAYHWTITPPSGVATTVEMATNQNFMYTFPSAGNYTVTLVVTDNDGNDSDPSSILVHAKSNQRLKVSLVWPYGGGDVDLHYIKPSGTYGGVDDCSSGNTAPNWVAYGTPTHSANSTGGVAEEVSHLNPADGTYTLGAKLATPAIINQQIVHEYPGECKYCDCACAWYCFIGTCCKSCTVVETISTPQPVNITFRLYFYGSTATPTVASCTGTVTLTPTATSSNPYYSIPLVRQNGEWKCPTGAGWVQAR